VLFNWDKPADELKADWVNHRPESGTTIGSDQLNPVLFNWNNDTFPYAASLSAVPEPSSVAMWLIALTVTGLTGLTGRRR